METDFVKTLDAPESVPAQVFYLARIGRQSRRVAAVEVVSNLKTGAPEK
jgi:hypothetical protein